MTLARSAARRLMVVAALMAAAMVGTVASSSAAAANEPTGAGQLGQQLSTHWDVVSDGVVQVTEYEGGTTAVGILAGCSFSITVNRPYKSGSRIYSYATFKVTGCSSSFVKSHFISEGSLSFNVPVAKSVTNWKAPVSSASSSVSMACKKGAWLTELSLDAGSNGWLYKGSSKRTISC